ncbi:hypothetical protein BD779DRAFT_515032 [Infundibulicybe gibba]|nr:hypothetical protein BD779DRAFT_515032 [Infundibulicybe gibba]
MAGFIPSSQPQIANYVHVSSLCLVIFDWFLTLDEEVTLIWGAPWSVGKILYLLTRYSAFIDLPVSVYRVSGPVPFSLCAPLTLFTGVMYVLGVWIAQAISILCVWAMCGRSRRATGLLSVPALVVVTTQVIAFIKYHSSPTFISDPGTSIGCQVAEDANSTNAVLLDFLPLIGLETMLLILTAQSARMLYYFFLDGASLADMIMALGQGTRYDFLLPSMQRASHSILSARILLQLRHGMHSMSGSSSETENAPSGEIAFHNATDGSSLERVDL